MKIFSIVVVVLALGLLVFNLTKIDYSNPFSEESSIALSGVVAAFCAIFIVLLFHLSKKIVAKK